MKKSIFALLLLVCMLLTAFPAAAEGEEERPLIYEGCKAVVYNPQSATFVYEQDGDARTESATSTKMTAVMIVFDNFRTRLDTVVTVTAASIKDVGNASNPATPMVGIKAGNTYTVEELLRTACVSWANDVVNTLIHAYCGDTDTDYRDFPDIMTEFAKSIGCEDTRYKEPLGKNGMGNRTSARDVALLCNEFYNRYEIFTATAQPYYVLQGSNIHNRNFIFSERIMPGNTIKGARGFFAGQASAMGGYCVATSYENGPLTYIVVVLDGCMFLYDEEGVRYFEEGKNPYKDVKTLIDWAKKSYNFITLCRAGEALDELVLQQGKGEDHLVVCAKNKIETITKTGSDLSGLEIKITYDTERVYTIQTEDGKEKKAIKAPVTKGEQIGMAEFIFNGAVVGNTQLLAAESIDADTVINFFDTVEQMLFSPTAKTILTVVLVLAGLYVLYCVTAFGVRTYKKVKKDVADTKKEQKLKELKERKNKKQ